MPMPKVEKTPIPSATRSWIRPLANTAGRK
jgi:hypothetical protein